MSLQFFMIWPPSTSRAPSAPHLFRLHRNAHFRGKRLQLRQSKPTYYPAGLRLTAPYTIVDAIRDKIVLPFRVDYLNSFRVRDGIDNHDVEGIDSAYMNPKRITAVVLILEHFDQKTKGTPFSSTRNVG